MPNELTSGSIAIKWRPSADESEVCCWLGPTDQPDPTDDWVSVLRVNRNMLEDDDQLYEDLIAAVNGWLLRWYATQGIKNVEFQRWPGGVPNGGEQ